MPTQEQVQKLYEKLPSELKTALFSEETAETISNVCEEYGIEDERVSQIAKYVGDVLMGFTLPSEFEQSLRQNVGLPEVLVKAISREINRFVFYPVKRELEELHRGMHSTEKQLGIPTPRHSTEVSSFNETGEDQTDPSKDIAEERPKRVDPYRETLE